MKHPIASFNEKQEKFLSGLPESERAFHAQLFRIGNATYRYHEAAKRFEPSEKDYSEWLSGLPDIIQRDMKAKGFQECKAILSFTRYVNEKNDIGMDAWLKAHLSEEDYTAHRTCAS